jgi:hypothetical protein
MLGKVCGVLSLDHPNVPCRISNSMPLVCVDMCGGDGLVTDIHDASPSIMYHHCERLAQKGKRSTLSIIEKAASTFEHLTENCSGMRGDIVTLSNADARTFVLPKLKSTQAAFIHCDPNNVDQVPLTEPFVATFNPFTTFIVTLGCNVGGLKMLTIEKRSEWFKYIGMLSKALPSNHEAVLFWLNGDSNQWAYLISIPKKWSDEYVRIAIKKGSQLWPRGVSAIQYRSNKIAFKDQVSKLFLTEAEYANR